jgi:tRNA pseudouridine38-40 synthase
MRYKIIIEYDGTPFVGWQRQDNGLSVQECIETAIESMFQEKPVLFGAGRTDAGVHATGQVAHFDIEHKELDTYSIKTGLNHHLKIYPISVLDVTEVDAEFHSRFDAKERKYLYRIVNRNSPLSIEKGRAWLVMKNLNLEKMLACAPIIEGKHDFTTFRSVNCQSKSPIKTLNSCKITQQDDNIYFGFVAPSFLRHQIRSLVGTIKMVGEGLWDIERLQQALDAKDRSKCGALAPAEGLYFMEVKY